MSSQTQRQDCPSCPHNKMLLGSECVKTCPLNTFNFVDRQCISRDSCAQENSENLIDFKFVPLNGSCKLIRYCDSIQIYDGIDTLAFEKAGKCQVVQGFVDIQFSSKSCENFSDLPGAIEFLSEIEEIRDYLKVTNSPTTKILGILPKLKTIRGENLESGEHSIVFKPRTGKKYLYKTLLNYTVSNEEFCTNNCDSSNNMTLEITPRTYGFVVKIMNEELKNFLDDKINFTSFVLNSDEYRIREICEPLTIPQQ